MKMKRMIKDKPKVKKVTKFEAFFAVVKPTSDE